MTSTYIKFNVNGIVSSDIAIRLDAISMYLLLSSPVIDLFVLIMSSARSLMSPYALLIDLIARENRFFFVSSFSFFFRAPFGKVLWPNPHSLLWGSLSGLAHPLVSRFFSRLRTFLFSVANDTAVTSSFSLRVPFVLVFLVSFRCG